MTAKILMAGEVKLCLTATDTNSTSVMMAGPDVKMAHQEEANLAVSDVFGNTLLVLKALIEVMQGSTLCIPGCLLPRYPMNSSTGWTSCMPHTSHRFQVPCAIAGKGISVILVP
jgi:hypothetical protein